MICTHTDTEVAQKNSLFLAGDVPGDGCKVLVEQVLCVWCGGQCWTIHADLGDWACGGVKAESQEALGACPCNMPPPLPHPLSMSVMDPKEEHYYYSLAELG